MKKTLFLICIFLFSTFLIGCFDIVEYVTADNNNVNININITISKSMVEIINSMSEEKLNYKDLLNENDIKGELPKELKISKIDNSADFGYSIKGSVSKKELSELKVEDSFFIPIKKGNGYVMPVYSGDSSKTDIDDATLSLMSAYKFRLFISKSYISNIKNAYVEAEGEVYNMNLYDFSDIYLIEMPLYVIVLKDAVLKIS